MKTTYRPKNCDFKFIELINIIKQKDFPLLLQFLEQHGGLDAVDEGGATALMILASRHVLLFSKVTSGGPPTDDFETEFAIRLIEQGCEINKTEKQSYSALDVALNDKNMPLLKALLSCENIVFPKIIALHKINDQIGELLIRAGYNIFTKERYCFTLDSLLDLHKGRSEVPFQSLNTWANFEKTLSAVVELYPERLEKVPSFYLDAVPYDFLMQDFYGLYPKKGVYLTKKDFIPFVKGLDKGINSKDEYGRNMLSCCILIYNYLKNTPRAKVERKKAVTRAFDLINMGISLTEPDFSGKTPTDYIMQSGNQELIDCLK